MKATLIYNEAKVMGIMPHYELKTKQVVASNKDELIAEAQKIGKTKMLIFYDGMLLELSNNPALVEVSTGIEL